jgi:hypothetical protein
MKRKALPGEYSNGIEIFRINKTDKEEIMTLHAITDVSYFPLKKGETIPLNIGTVESIINDDDLNYRPRK